MFNVSDDIIICKRQRSLMWNQLKNIGIQILETTTCTFFFTRFFLTTEWYVTLVPPHVGIGGVAPGTFCVIWLRISAVI